MQYRIIRFVIKTFVLIGCIAMAYEFLTVLGAYSEAW